MILVKHNNEGNYKPYFYFALEKYILENVLKDDEAYFFTWKIHGVVIGKNQVIENEVNMEYLKEHNIDIYRRPTGGGTIYADKNNTMYTMITKRTQNFSFKPYLNKVIEAMAKLNLKIEFSGRNDLLYDNKKISGVAFLQNKYGVLIHGTYMYDVDIDTLIRTITPNNEKLISKGIDSVRSRVTNLKPALNGMAEADMIKHLENEITSKTYVLNEEEIAKITEMAKEFESYEWRFKNQPGYTLKLSKRLTGGTYNINIDLNKGVIEDMKIYGDYFDLTPIEQLEQLFIGKDYTKETIHNVLEPLDLEKMLLDINKLELISLLESGIIG